MKILLAIIVIGLLIPIGSIISLLIYLPFTGIIRKYKVLILLPTAVSGLITLNLLTVVASWMNLSFSLIGWSIAGFITLNLLNDLQRLDRFQEKDKRKTEQLMLIGDLLGYTLFGMQTLLFGNIFLL